MTSKSSITIDDARWIREQIKQGKTDLELARRFGVHTSVITNINLGRTFRMPGAYPKDDEHGV